MKAQVNVTIDTEVLEVIRSMNINLSAAINEYLKALVSEPMPERIEANIIDEEIKTMSRKLNTLKMQKQIVDRQNKEAEDSKKKAQQEIIDKYTSK